MAQITGQELLTVKRILADLNNAFPTVQPGIPVKKWEGNKFINTFSPEDPYFLAYKNFSTNTWWLIARNYGVWTDAYRFMRDYCSILSREFKVKAYPCHEHPISCAYYKELHKQKRVLLLGEVSWA